MRRVLKSNGRILILEASFSESAAVNRNPSYDSEDSAKEAAEIARLFLYLKSDEERLAFIHFSDWFIHHFVNRSREPLVPGNYKTMEQWERMFRAAGLRIVQAKYLGFSRLGSRNPSSRAMFVIEPEIPLADRAKPRDVQGITFGIGIAQVFPEIASVLRPPQILLRLMEWVRSQSPQSRMDITRRLA